MTQFRWLLGAALLTRCGSQIAVATPLDLVTYNIDFVEGTEASGFPEIPTLPTNGTFTYDCQGRSKNRPLGRRESRPLPG